MSNSTSPLWLIPFTFYQSQDVSDTDKLRQIAIEEIRQMRTISTVKFKAEHALPQPIVARTQKIRPWEQWKGCMQNFARNIIECDNQCEIWIVGYAPASCWIYMGYLMQAAINMDFVIMSLIPMCKFSLVVRLSDLLDLPCTVEDVQKEYNFDFFESDNQTSMDMTQPGRTNRVLVVLLFARDDVYKITQDKVDQAELTYDISQVFICRPTRKSVFLKTNDDRKTEVVAKNLGLLLQERFLGKELYLASRTEFDGHILFEIGRVLETHFFQNVSLMENVQNRYTVSFELSSYIQPLV